MPAVGFPLEERQRRLGKGLGTKRRFTPRWMMSGVAGELENDMSHPAETMANAFNKLTSLK